MTDEDLIHHLRHSKGWPTLGNAAADRIEVLEAKLTKAMLYVEWAHEVGEMLEGRRSEFDPDDWFDQKLLGLMDDIEGGLGRKALQEKTDDQD